MIKKIDNKINDFLNTSLLTLNQKEVFKNIIKTLIYEDKILIKGSAGTGKTFLAQELIKFYSKDYIICSAPTNKATSVLQGKLEGLSNVEFMSVHAALKMKRKFLSDGRIVFMPDYIAKYPPLQYVKYFIIDEASMIDDNLFNYIEEHSKAQSCKVIFLGDEKQLPPVCEKISPVFSHNISTFHLTEIIRQGKGNPIIDISYNLDKVNCLKNNIIVDENENSVGYLYTSDFDRVKEKLIESNGSSLYKYGAYTNERVNAINKLIRHVIYGKNAKKVEIGETIIFDAPYKGYITNEELLIKDIDIFESEFMCYDKLYSFKFYCINPIKKGGYLPLSDILVLHEDSTENLKDAINYLKDKVLSNKIKWKNYFEFVEQFAIIKHSHSLTIHKMQGSTYDNIIIDLNDIKKCKKRDNNLYNKLLYTGITRARNKCIFYIRKNENKSIKKD